jgi:hypothetical protein
MLTWKHTVSAGSMENNEQNLAAELDELVPIAPADNDVFTPGFCSLLDPAFKSAPSPTQTAGNNVEDTG